MYGRKKLKSARLYICGLGLYEAYLNGQKVGEEYLTPGCFAYDKWLQYQTWDVTGLLAGGRETELSVLLGNGWYKGRFGYENPDAAGFYGTDWLLLAELVLEYGDGTKETVGTDESWGVRRSRIIFSNIYDGEIVDGRLEEADDGEHAVLAAAPKAPLTGRKSMPVKAREQLSPVSLLHTPAGEWVFDLGQNFAGIFRLRVHEAAGTRIRLQFGEILQNGNFCRENLRTAKQEYVFYSDGEEHILMPHFTFYGYRYVKAEGITDPRIEDFTGIALYSEMEEAGKIETGNKLVNRLISNVRWGLKSNFIDVPTDCPQRDERMGWTGDAQVFCPTACYLEDCYPFYSKFLYDMRKEQEAADGMAPEVIPAFGHGRTSAAWGDAACVIPWKLYQFYGDPAILEEQFSGMTAWVDYITGFEEKKGWGNHFHYGDWLALDGKQEGGSQFMGGTEEAYIAYICYMNSAEITAKAAEILGKTQEEEKYGRIAGKLRERIRNEYFTPSGRCCVDTQTGQLLALRYDLSSNPEKVRQRLKELLARNKNRLETGFVGTPLLCPVLSENGMEDLAWQLLLNEEYPGWLHEVKLGATTVWERWNSVQDDGSLNPSGMNSLNHYSYGSVVGWIFACAAGIRQREGRYGFREAFIAPEVHPGPGYLDAEFASAAGTYRVKWEIPDEEHLEVSVHIPFGCRAELILPESEGETRYLTAGDFVFKYKTRRRLRKICDTNVPAVNIMNHPAASAALEKVFPQFKDLPAAYYSKSLREIFELMSDTGELTGELKQYLGMIDQVLAGA